MVAKLIPADLQQLGNYQLLEKIGKGGMGSVYKARRRAGGDLVAIKTVSAAVADHPILRKRFEQEFHTARLLDHPHIVRAFDFGQEGTLPYLVMEYVDGPSLGQRIESDGRLPEPEAIAIAVQIAHALHAAHQQGIIHRDVKPDNILLGPGGQAKLTDLGLVKDLDTHLELTQASAVLGTPNFMAPEQFTDSKNVDFGCDIYSLGATLYMAVTGVIPFLAKGHISTLKKKITDEIQPPRQLVSGLSARLDQAILRAIQADRKQRPASCLEFIAELTGVPPGQITLPRRTSERRHRKHGTESSPRGRRAAERRSSQMESHCRPIHGALNSGWTATFRDVSTRGIGLVVNRRFEPGTLLMIELPGTNHRFIRLLLARVVHVHQQSPQFWIIGCELDRPLSDEDVESLR